MKILEGPPIHHAGFKTQTQEKGGFVMINAENITNVQIQEQLVSPERPKLLLIKTVAVAGPSNVGKDVLVDNMHDYHGWPIFDGTSLGFKRRKQSADQSPIARKLEIHRLFDIKQGKRFEKLSVNDAHELHQTRLSGIILAEEKDEWSKKLGHSIRKNEWLRQQGLPTLPLPQEIPAISLLLWARKEVRVERAYNHALNAWQNQQEKIAQGIPLDTDEKLLPKPTKTAIEARIDFRDKQDVIEWAPHHPKYIQPGKDPFRRTLTRPNGGPVYDYFLDNSDLTLEETELAFEKILIEAGAARKMTEEEKDESEIYAENSGDLKPNQVIAFNRIQS